MRRLSFSTRFALILTLLGALIAGATVAIPLAQAARERDQSALDRVADRSNTAIGLLAAEQRSLTAFATASAAELAGAPDPDHVVAGIAGATDSADVVGYIHDGVITTAGAVGTVSQAWLRDVASRQNGVVTDPRGAPWLAVNAPVPGLAGAAVITVRPLNHSVFSGLIANAGGVAGAGIAIVKHGEYVVEGTVGGTSVRAGEAVDSGLAEVAQTGGPSSIVGSGGRDLAVASAPIGGGFRVLVTGTVTGDAITGSVLAPVGLIAAVLILTGLAIVYALVQRDLQRPLRRLDRAVAALAAEDFDHPVAVGEEDEIGRLGASFDAMRRELLSVLRSAEARASIAVDLTALSPLPAALEATCLRLRATTGARKVLLVLGADGDEAVYSSGIADPPPPDRFLRGDGPLAAAARLPAQQVLMACPLPGAPEADAGCTTLCAAPLRVGTRLLGAVGLADRPEGFTRHHAELLTAVAEQIALAVEREHVLAAARLQASTDGLTGLNNRRFLTAYLDQQVALSDRSRTPFSLLMLDIDNFKEINDTLGHEVGDNALVAVARTLETSLRRSDLAARFGGDEFVVVMTETDSEDAAGVAEKVRAAVSRVSLPTTRARRKLRLAVSIGVATRHPRGAGVDRVLTLADNALYDAKRSGRDRVVVAPVDESPPVTGERRERSRTARTRG